MHSDSPIILNVDDRQPSRYVRTRVLENAGFAVREARNAGDALRLASEVRPDAVLLDINLPDLSGFEVCRRLKAAPATAFIPVIHISAMSRGKEAQVEGAESGADVFLTEPVEPAVLVSTLKSVVRNTGAMRKLEWLMVAGAARPALEGQPYGNLAELNGCRVLADAVPHDVLRDITLDYFDLLETSSAIYETNGDPAMDIAASGWCRMLDVASRNLCHTPDNRAALGCGKWLCQEACRRVTVAAMRRRRPVDAGCPGGLRLYALPIYAGGDVVGGINFAYGDPPRDPASLARIARLYQVDADQLQAAAKSYESRPPFIIDAAKRRLLSSARLIGAMVERKRVESQLEQAVQRTDESAGRVRRLHAITAALGEAVTSSDVLDTIISRVMQETGAQSGLVALFDENGTDLIPQRVAGLPPEAAEPHRPFLRDADCPAVLAARNGDVVLGQGGGCCNPSAQPAGAVVGVPIWLHGRTLGAIGLGFPKDAWFGTQEREFFLTVGRECAQALERARLYDARERARRQLQEQRRFLETVMQQMPLGVAIIDAASRKVLMANAEASQILGGPPAGPAKLADLAPLGGTHPDGRPYRRAEYPLLRSLARGEVVQQEDLMLHRPDGSTPTLSISSAPLRDADGRIVAAVSAFQDITEHRHEREVRSRQLQLINLSNDAIVTATPDRVITTWNSGAQETYGWTAAEAIGKPMSGLIETRAGAPLEEISAVLEREAHWEGEVRQCRKDGAEIVVESRQALVRDGRGEPAAILFINRDVTERRKADAAHHNAQRLESVGLLAGGIAHDFNNLLTGILGNASLLMSEVGETAAERLDAIVKCAESAADLTRQLLAYAGKGRFLVEPLDLSRVVREMTDLLRVSIPRHIELRRILDDGVAIVNADAGHIQQVIMNLAMNAAEAIGDAPGGTVTLATGVERLEAPENNALGVTLAPGDYAYIEVSDNGGGMDEETRAKILEPFFTTKFLGRGLGLAAVAGILRSHQGGLRIRSAPGSGSTFRALFPAMETRVKPRPQVLVVDDEDAVREVIRGVLERAGYAVTTAANGRDALAILDERRGRFDLVLLDVVMPVAGGGEVLAQIRSRWPEAKVLLTSGYSQDEVERLCGGLRNAQFIQKPYTAAQLAHKVKTAMQRAQTAGA